MKRKKKYQKYFRSYFKRKTSFTEHQLMISDFTIIKEKSLRKKILHYLLTSSISFSFGDPEQRQTRQVCLKLPFALISGWSEQSFARAVACVNCFVFIRCLIRISSRTGPSDTKNSFTLKKKKKKPKHYMHVTELTDGIYSAMVDP